MVTLTATTLIAAPIARCFALSLNLDVELQAVKGLSAIDGVTHGQIGPGERVTWRTRQFGIPVRHTTEISAYERPSYFQDRMIRGIFSSFAHDHYFEAVDAQHTRMRDVLRLSVPWFLGGPVSEVALVKRRMAKLLAQRNNVIKAQAEQDAGEETPPSA